MKCSHCRKTLTQFDAQFQNELPPKRKAEGVCFRCYAKVLADPITRIYNGSRILRTDLIIAFFCLLSLVCLCIPGETESILWLNVPGGFLFFGLWIFGACRAIKYMGLYLSDDYHYEKKLVSRVESNGTITTRVENEMISDDDTAIAVVWGVTYPLWCVFRPIIKLIANFFYIKKRVPRGMRVAFNKAKRKIKRIYITKHAMNRYTRKMSAFNRSLKPKPHDGTLYGEWKSSRRPRRLVCPELTLSVNHRTYTVVMPMRDNYNFDLLFAVEGKEAKKICVSDGYLAYDEEFESFTPA